MIVTAASVHDSAGGRRLLDELAATYPSVTKVWADGGYQTSVFKHGVGLGIDVEVVKAACCQGISAVAEAIGDQRTFGRLMQHRRLARDYEALPPAPQNDPLGYG
ncbi:transposase [Streptomyces sp. SYSU K217416]